MTQMMTHFSQCQRNNLLLKNPLNSPHNSVLSTMLLTTDTNNKLDHTTAYSSNCVLTLWCWHQRANNPTELAPIELLAHCWWQESPKGGSNRSCLWFKWTGSPFQYQNGYWDLLFWYCICPTQPIFTNTETAILSLSPQSRQVAWFMSSELRNEIFSKKLVTNILLQCYFMRYILHFLVLS